MQKQTYAQLAITNNHVTLSHLRSKAQTVVHN